MVNLADEKAVKKAALKEGDLKRQQENDIRTVLSNASGQRLLWRILEKCNTFGSVFNRESNSTMAYLSGQQDLGHFIIAEIMNADENLWLKLMKLNSKKES